MRRALNLAVDPERFVAEVLQGYATPLAGLTPPWAKGYPEGLTPYPYDPDQARALLDEAGWPFGRPLRVTAPPPLAEVAGWLADRYPEALGIEVELLLPPEEDLAAAEPGSTAPILDGL